MGLILYSCGHILGHHEPIPTKFVVWRFFIMLYRNMEKKSWKCWKNIFDDIITLVHYMLQVEVEYSRKISNPLPILHITFKGKGENGLLDQISILSIMEIKMCMSEVKVTAMSLKLEVRLHAHSVGTNTWSGTEVKLHSFDWIMRSELGYFAHSLNSGFNNGAATLKFPGQVGRQTGDYAACGGCHLVHAAWSAHASRLLQWYNWWVSHTN